MTGAGGFLRFARLTTPPSLVFDENYYVPDSYGILRHGAELNHLPSAGTLIARGDTRIFAAGGEFVAHPPLAKIMIASGEWLFGLTPFGWRFASAVVGTLAILMTARIVRRMTGSVLVGSIAGLLLAVDGLELVMSRTAMLDIFLMFWVLAAFGCLVIDRDQRRTGPPGPATARAGIRGRVRAIRWWRVAAGICLGLACACKWSALWYIPAFACLTIAWDITATRESGATAPVRTALSSAARSVPAVFVLAPLAAYLASYSGWLASSAGFDRTWAAQHGNHLPVLGALDSLYQVTLAMLHYGMGLVVTGPTFNASQPSTWLLLAKPTMFSYASNPGCGTKSCVQEILAIGTPAIWWTSIAALGVCLAWWLARRDWRAGAVLMAVMAGWLPWVWFASDGHRVVYYFYAVALDPFLVIAIALSLGLLLDLGRRSNVRHWRILGATVTIVYLAAVIADFGYLYPVLTGSSVSHAAWLARMWYHGWLP